MTRRVLEWRGGPTSRRTMADSKEQASPSVLTTSKPSHVLVGDENGHVLVVGAPRTHKTSGIVVPMMLAWDGAQLVVAGDMAVLNAYEYLEDEQRSPHRELCLDPNDVEKGARWNPLTSIRDGALGLACPAKKNTQV